MIKQWGEKILVVFTFIAVLLTYSGMTAVSVNAETTSTDNEALSSYGFFKWMSTNQNATVDEREDARVAVQIMSNTVEEAYKTKVFNNGRIYGSSSGATYDLLLENTHFGAENDATSLENLRAAITYINMGNECRAKENLPALNVSSGLMAMGEMDANYIGVSWGHSLVFYSLENLARGGSTALSGITNYNPYDGWYDAEKKQFDAGNESAAGHYKTLTDRNGNVKIKVTGIGVAISKSGNWYYKGISQMHSDLTQFYAVGDGTTTAKYLAYVNEYTCNVQGHTWGAATAITAATCTESGSEKHTCSVCGETDTSVIDALGHNWNNGVITKAPTCVATGVKSFTCERCDSTKTEIVAEDSSNHVGGQTITGKIEVTCEKNGYTGDTHCNSCNALLEEGSVVTAKGHVWDNGKVTKEATCTEQGEKEYTCSTCSGTKTEELPIDASNHVHPSTTGTEAATCTTDGFTGKTICEDCNAVIDEGRVISATGHKWNNGEVTKAATTSETGIKTYTCTECKATKTEVIAKLKVTVTPAPAASITITNATEEVAAANILAMKGDGDLKDSTYSLIQLKNGKNTKTSIKLSWKKVNGAIKYVVYGSKCGTKLKKLTITSSAAYTNSKLKKGTYYKYMVVAINSNNKVIGSSKMIHVGTTGGKICNVKKITSANAKNSKTLKKGKTFTWKTKVVKTSNKLTLKTHRKVKFETTNKNVATVSASGKIKAVKKGTCYIYAYSQNGVGTKIKIQVK